VPAKPYCRRHAVPGTGSIPYNWLVIIKEKVMTTPPKINLSSTPDYRENYANSVQVRWSVWDFCLTFGLFQQQAEDAVDIRNFQAIYLSPQQAKALLMILQQNVVNYEKTFGEIKLDPRLAASGIIN
jgi:hypothetical protein